MLQECGCILGIHFLKTIKIKKTLKKIRGINKEHFFTHNEYEGGTFT